MEFSLRGVETTFKVEGPSLGIISELCLTLMATAPLSKLLDNEQMEYGV